MTSQPLQIGVGEDSTPHNNSVLAPQCVFFIMLAVVERQQLCFYTEDKRGVRDVYRSGRELTHIANTLLPELIRMANPV